jgi:hypothetical protein
MKWLLFKKKPFFLRKISVGYLLAYPLLAGRQEAK